MSDIQNISSELPFTSGISEEDQAEIRAHVNAIAGSNRRQYTTKSFTIKARESGLVFPVLVNVSSIMIVGLLVAAFILFFNQQQNSITKTSTVIVGAENQVVAALRNQYAAQIADKDKDLADTQSKLAALAAEKEKLAATMNSKIASREKELQDQMSVKLEAERARLKSLHLSNAEIEVRLKKFAAQKDAELQSTLAAFKRQAEAEKAAQEARDAKLQAAYAQQIAALNQEKNRITEERNQKEAQLATANKAKEVATQNDAQAKLALLNAEREAQKAMEDRIISLYASALSSLSAGNIASASSQSKSLLSYLDRDDVKNMQGNTARRKSFLLAAQSLQVIVDAEVSRSGPDDKALANAKVLKDLQDSYATLQAENESLKQEKIKYDLNRKTETDAAKKASDAAQKRIDLLEKQIADIKTQLAAEKANKNLASLQAPQAANESNAPTVVIKGTTVLTSITASYQEFSQQSDQLLAKAQATPKGPARNQLLIDEQNLRNKFFNNQYIEQLMPGFGKKISSYEAQQLEAGQSEVLYNAIDILTEARTILDDNARIAYLNKKLEQVKYSTSMTAFVTYLKAWL